MKKLLTHCALVVGLATGLAAAPAAFAKLPAPTPTPTPEAKAKAAEAAAKTAWSAKVDSFQLCQAQTRVATRYREAAAAAGRQLAPATPTPPCTDPGPFAYAPPAEEAKPIEASGAHSPATTAASPPSSNQTSAEINPAPKK